MLASGSITLQMTLFQAFPVPVLVEEVEGIHIYEEYLLLLFFGLLILALRGLMYRENLSNIDNSIFLCN